ncbi:MAG: RNA polymerase sigma factor SigJ [Anaerolineae bacterium]|nr:RNA polymerase sigma factor SigJ [Anaerolineae bacterium]
MTDDPFEAVRPKLFAIAYRMMGSAIEAEDIVQDAYLRWHAADRAAVQSPAAYLRRTVIRLCLDAQKSARARREAYPGVWLPEPIREGWPDAPPPSPEERVTEWESLSVAFLLLLEQLTPEERAVFLLREVFGYGYTELSEALGKSEAACRQMFSRARKHITDHRPRFTSTPDQHQRVFGAFMQAVNGGSLDALVGLLAEDVVAVSDGGGKSPAFVRPIIGRDAVAKMLLGLMHRAVKTPGVTVEVVALNGQPGLLLRSAELGDTAMLPHIVDGVVRAVYFVRNPDKLSRLIT